MANFKVAKKNAVSDTRTNIYDLHEKKLEFFEIEKKNIKKYTAELECLQKKEPGNIQKINELSDKIYNLENDIDKNQYLLDFFLIINKKSGENNITGTINNYVNYTLDNTKSELYNEYISHFNPELEPIPIQTNVTRNICKNCNSMDSILEEQRLGTETCMNCGNSIENMLVPEKGNGSAYTQTHEQIFVFNYDRKNHFQECLNQLQAKENTKIPQKIIDDLIVEFKKYNINDVKMFTPTLVKSYLKKLKYNKYYEHIPTIINEFCGIRAPKITPELEQQLKIMFDEIQAPFEKYSKIICPNRKNFLNYNYVFYKMCQLLSKDEFLHCFPLLKSREKLYEHDLIWKGICKDIHWEFIASI
jgi:hypothetical protein